MTVPALRELRRLLPDAHITLATRAFAEGVFADSDFLDDILICDGPAKSGALAQAREWKRRRFDLAIPFQNAFKAALIPFLARVPYRVGYATEGRGFLLTNAFPSPSWRNSRHESFYYLNIIAGLERLLSDTSQIPDHEPVFDLAVSKERRNKANEILQLHGVTRDRLLIALCPGSINSRAKRWPAERYAALADQLIERMNAQVLLVGSTEELAVSNEVSQQMRHHPIFLTGKTSLAQAVAILSGVDLLITNDTGPAHIAAALRRPTLVIFGPTNPLTTRPLSPGAEIVRHPPDCAPCMLRDCPIDHRCMTAITPEEVFDRARAMLATRLAATGPAKHSGEPVLTAVGDE